MSKPSYLLILCVLSAAMGPAAMAGEIGGRKLSETGETVRKVVVGGGLAAGGLGMFIVGSVNTGSSQRYDYKNEIVTLERSVAVQPEVTPEARQRQIALEREIRQTRKALEKLDLMKGDLGDPRTAETYQSMKKKFSEALPKLEAEYAEWQKAHGPRVEKVTYTVEHTVDVPRYTQRQVEWRKSKGKAQMVLGGVMALIGANQFGGSAQGATLGETGVIEPLSPADPREAELHGSIAQSIHEMQVRQEADSGSRANLMQ